MNNLAPVPVEQMRIMPTSRIVDYYLSQQTEGTGRTYGATIRSFFAWCGKDYRSVDPFDALEFDKHLKATTSPATVQRQISTLKGFFAFAKECGLIDKNPFAVIKQKSAANRAAERFLTQKEINKLLKALKETNEKHFILGLLLVATGMRISEVQQLSWNSFVEMADGSISVNVLRKGGEYQLLPLRDDVWQAIKSFTGKEIDAQDSSPIFLNPSLKRASSVSLRTWIEEGAKKAGIKKKVTPHFLRHSFATNSLNNNADIRDVSWYLGHSNLKTTSIYAHPTNKRVGEFIPLEIED